MLLQMISIGLVLLTKLDDFKMKRKLIFIEEPQGIVLQECPPTPFGRDKLLYRRRPPPLKKRGNVEVISWVKADTSWCLIESRHAERHEYNFAKKHDFLAFKLCFFKER